jgi:hypothetical protein
MSTLLITVALGKRRRDLAVRADMPIADLLEPIADLLEPIADLLEPRAESPGAAALPTSIGSDTAGPDALSPAFAGTGAEWRRALGLAPLCGEALPLGRSLEACGIGHGAVLVLVRAPEKHGLRVR